MRASKRRDAVHFGHATSRNAHGRRRASWRRLCITGLGAGETQGHGGFLHDRIIYPCFTTNRYRDKERQEEMIRASNLHWVIVRPAPFHEGRNDGRLQAVTDVQGVTLRRSTREEVARFVVDQSSDDRFLRQTPFIGHAHWRVRAPGVDQRRYQPEREQPALDVRH